MQTSSLKKLGPVLALLAGMSRNDLAECAANQRACQCKIANPLHDLLYVA